MNSSEPAGGMTESSTSTRRRVIRPHRQSSIRCSTQAITCTRTTPATRRWENLSTWRYSSTAELTASRPDEAFFRMLVQELEREHQHLFRELICRQVAELVLERLQRNDRLGHRSKAAGAADVGEVLAHELA